MPSKNRRGGGGAGRGCNPSGKPSGEPGKKLNWKLLLILTANTAVIFGLYRFLIKTPASLYIFFFYLAAATLLILGYVIYNRGFSRSGITPEMLPEEMSEDEKREFIADAGRRGRKSRWMLTLIIPMLFTFAYEVFELFLLDYLKELWF